LDAGSIPAASTIIFKSGFRNFPESAFCFGTPTVAKTAFWELFYVVPFPKKSLTLD